MFKLQQQAENRDRVLDVVGDITAKMRGKLGESLRSIENFDVPIEQATTPSFDALLALSRGTRQTDAESIPYFERAIQLDPNFAMAYEYIGVAQGNLGNMKAAKEAFGKAYSLRQNVGASEQFVINSRYFEIVQEDPDLAAQNYVMWTRSYPLDRWAWATLANTYTQMGRYKEAIAAGEHALAIDRKYGFAYVVLARAYKRASQFDKAKAICAEALSHGINLWGIHSILYQVAVAEHDEPAMLRESIWDKGMSTENQTLDNAAFAAATDGQLAHAEELFRVARMESVRSGSKDFTAELDADEGESQRLLGSFRRSRESVARVPADSTEVAFEAAIHAALGGDVAYAMKVIEQQKLAPETSTLVHRVRIPLLKAAIALQLGHPQDVPGLLAPAHPYELRDYYVFSILGEAYLAQHQPEEAATEYRQVLDNPGIDPLSPMYPLAHLGLARAYAMNGNLVGSKAEYQALFELWKQADKDLPALQDARQEFNRLTLHLSQAEKVPSAPRAGT